MKTPNLVISISLVALALLAFASPAKADLLAYEPFDYTAGVGLSTVPGSGFGFKGDWIFEISDSTVNAGSLDPIGDSALLLTNGNSANSVANIRSGREIDTSQAQFAPYVNQDGNLGADDTTLYMSFLLEATNNEAAKDGIGSWGLRAGTAPLGDGGIAWLLGNDRPAPEARPSLWHIYTGETHLHFIGADDARPEAEFYVVRMDFKDGNDEVRVYRNPTLGVEPGTPDAEDLDYPNIQIDAVQLQAFFPDRGTVLGTDEIRIGETYADVTPVVPEPGSLVLLLAGGLGLLLGARRLRK